MSTADLSLTGDLVDGNNISNNHAPSTASKKSKTRKVLSVAKRPLRAVGRLAKGKSKASLPASYGSIDEEGDEDDDDEMEVDMNHHNHHLNASDPIPDIITPVVERRGSFMERVNSYRSGASLDGALPGNASAGPSTPRRGSLTNAFRTGVGVVGNSLGGGPTFPSMPGDDGSSLDQRDWVVFRLERYLRHLMFILLAFIVGTFRFEWRNVVQRLLEYTAVAWATCCVLWVMAAFGPPRGGPNATTAAAHIRPRRLVPASTQHSRAASSSISANSGAETNGKRSEAEVERKKGRSISIDSTEDTKRRIAEQISARSNHIEPGDIEARGGIDSNDDELAMLLPKNDSQVKLSGGDDDDDDAKAKRRRRSLKKKKAASAAVGDKEAFRMAHPALNPFYCIDTEKGERVMTNSRKAYVVENDWFTGTMMVLIRTPDVDDSSHPKGNEENDDVVKYMKDKQRRWEFQYQIKLKKLPGEKKIYFSAELEEPVKLGMIQRAFVGAAMAFIKSTNGSFHYSMAGSKEDPDGRWEKPHMSFPVEMSMDRLIATKPGEEIPKLGNIINEDPEAMKHRKKGGLIDWNLEDTYTMALWTAYVDFLDWRVINLPGIRPFELNKVIGPQPILLTLYLIDKDRAAEKHYRRDITQVVELELCNTTAALMGPNAKAWAAKKNGPESAVVEDEEDADDDEEDIDNDDDGDHDDEEDEDDDDDEEEADRQLGQGDEMLVDETEYDAADAATAAELGEGMYLRSGDSVVLRESGAESDENDASCYVTNGAGFAVLCEGVTSASTIVIQKARREKHRSKARNELIKSGDTVSIMMVTKGLNQETETRYLTIHRGWWLKWVNTPPKKNGFFTIFTHETEFEDHDPDDLRAGETQSAFLTFGGSFWLRHKRWSHYSVGAAAEGSATYGGRVMGLFQPRSGTNPTNEVNYASDDEEEPSLGDGKADKKRWMKALQFRAYETGHSPTSVTASVTGAAPKFSEEQLLSDDAPAPTEQRNLVFSSDDSRLDVPAWVEVLNRTKRSRQLAYAVRVVPSAAEANEESKESADPSSQPFIRLRTGRDLAEIMRVGLSWRSTAVFTQEKDGPPTPVSPQKIVSASSADGMATPGKSVLTTSASSRVLPGNNSMVMDNSFDDLNYPDEEAAWEDSDDDDDTAGGGNLDSSGPTKKSKRRIVGSTIGAIGKVARGGAKVTKAGAKASVKAGVAVTKAGVGVTKAGAATGKKVVVSSVKASVKVGKGTVRVGKGTVSAGVSAGKAIIGSTSRSKNPPAREPRSKTVGSAKIWKKERNLHVAVNKTVKRIGTEQSHLFFLAGELAAPEQSYRTVSNVLARMSSVPTSSPFSKKFNSILSTQIGQSSDQDSWFLSGGAMQVGVVPDSKSESANGTLVCESLVARCLWESHWREEWCGVYEKNIAFYAPLTHKPCHELAIIDVQSIRLLDHDDQSSPLPGFPILAIETAWQCHYVAFSNDEARESFRAKLEDLVPKRRDVQISVASEKELYRARFWQGFQNSVESDSAIGRGKWADVGSGKKSISRSILNGRRMDFDLDPDFLKEAGGLGEFVQDLLSTSLSFSLSSLERDPERLVKFLDAVSHLRLVPILDIDKRGIDAFCLFVNLYHCLLQHALLLAVNGPLHRRTVGHFMRASCYEIGGDIFSLAEIQSCIIRGNMSRAVSPKPPYIGVSKKSNAYRFYALEYTDPRVNFVLNTADVSCPKEVPILRPETLDDQLSTASVLFLENQLTVDVIRRCILLPKVCEVYRHDFENEASGCLYFCSRFLDQATVNALKRMLREETTLTIKYQPSAEQYHTKLNLQEQHQPLPPPSPPQDQAEEDEGTASAARTMPKSVNRSVTQ